MTSRPLIDPVLVSLLSQLPEEILTAESLPQLRASFQETLKPLLVDWPSAPAIEEIERLIPGPPGAPMSGCCSIAQNLPLLLYLRLCGFHGGGFVMGTVEMSGPQLKLHVYPGAFHGFTTVERDQVALAHNSAFLNALTRALSR